MQQATRAFDFQFVVDRINELVAGEPKEFAWRTDISLSAVYNYLNGRTPTVPILFKIATAYKKDFNWFFSEFQPQQPAADLPVGKIERKLKLVRRAIA